METAETDLTNAYDRIKPKQRKFVDRLCLGEGRGKAALEAGFSAKDPERAAEKLLKRPMVRAAYDQRRAAIAEMAGVEAIRVVHELAKIGFANMLDYVDLSSGDPVFDLTKITREQGAAIHELIVDSYVEEDGNKERVVKRIKLKLAEKKGPLELIGKYLKIWTEKHEHSGPGGTSLAPPVFNFGFKNGGPGIAADTRPEGT